MMSLEEAFARYRYTIMHGLPYEITIVNFGELRGRQLNAWTGEFESANSKIDIILFEDHDYKDRVSRLEFINAIEATRAEGLRGTGPIFDIYSEVGEIISNWEDRGPTYWENALPKLNDLRSKTFDMWEQEFSRLRLGNSPTFEYKSVTGREIESLRKIDSRPDLTLREVAGLLDQIYGIDWREKVSSSFLDGVDGPL